MLEEPLSLKEILISLTGALNRSKYYLIVGSVAGCAFGVYKNQRPKVYETKFSIESTVINPHTIARIVTSFGESIQHGQVEALASQSNCDPQIISSITSVPATVVPVISGVPISEHWCTVTLTLTDPSIATQASECVLRYVTQNVAVTEKISVFLKNRNETLTEINKKIASLNSYLNEILAIMKSDKPLPMGVYGGGGYREMLDLLKTRAELMDEIELGQEIRISDPAYTPTRARESNFKNIVTGLLGGLFLAMAVAMILELRRYIRS